MIFFEKIKKLFKKRTKENRIKWCDYETTLFYFKDVDAVLKFYETCIEQNVNTIPEKIKILKEMAENRDGIIRVVQTNRTRDQVLEDLAREHNVLDIQFKPKKENNDVQT